MVRQNFEAKKIKYDTLKQKLRLKVKDFLSNNCDFGVSNNLVFLCHTYDLPKHDLFF